MTKPETTQRSVALGAPDSMVSYGRGKSFVKVFVRQNIEVMYNTNRHFPQQTVLSQRSRGMVVFLNPLAKAQSTSYGVTAFKESIRQTADSQANSQLPPTPPE